MAYNNQNSEKTNWEEITGINTESGEYTMELDGRTVSLNKKDIQGLVNRQSQSFAIPEINGEFKISKSGKAANLYEDGKFVGTAALVNLKGLVTGKKTYCPIKAPIE